MSAGSRVGGQGSVDPLVQCAEVLKGHRLPCDADVPIWVDEVEKMFSTYRVPDEARMHLIMPALTVRVRYLLRNLDLEDCAVYEQVKRAMLDELQLAPPEYREPFDSTSKRKDENRMQFASRVRTYLSYYLRAREAESKETMLELLVADRLKASLSPDRLENVPLHEGETWLRAHEIAKVSQTYHQAKGTKCDAKGGKSRREDSELAPNQTHNGKTRHVPRCFLCHEPNHLAKDCLRRSKYEGSKKQESKPKSFAYNVRVQQDGNARAEDDEPRGLVARLAGEVDEVPTSKLQRVKLLCADVPTDAILGTGCEITVVRENLPPTDVKEPSGTVKLVSVFRQAIVAKLARIPIRLRSDITGAEGRSVHVVCALTDQLAPEIDCLLTREDWKLLGEDGHLERDDAAFVTLGVPIVGNEDTTTEDGENTTTFACSARIVRSRTAHTRWPM